MYSNDMHLINKYFIETVDWIFQLLIWKSDKINRIWLHGH